MWLLTRTLLTLAAVWSTSVCAGAEELKELAAAAAQPSAAIPQPAGAQNAPIIKDVPIDKLRNDPDPVLNYKPLADNPQIPKEILFTSPDLNSDKPVQDVKSAIIPNLSDKPIDAAERKIPNHADSLLNAKLPSDNPPQIPKEILFTPPDLNSDKPVQDVKSAIIPNLSDKPIDAAERKLPNHADSLLNAKLPADNPPQIPKGILFTPPDLNNDKPVQDVKSAILPITPNLNDKPIDTAERKLQNDPDSVLISKPPADNPPQILKEILFAPPNLNNDKPVQDVKPAITPIMPTLFDKPLLNDKPSVVNADVDKPVLLSPHSPSAREGGFPPAEDSPARPDELLSKELKQKLEESLIRIKEAINEASPALIAAASDGTSKVKLEAEDKKPEKPEEPTQHKSYAEIVGHFVTQLLEIPIVFIGAVREAMSGLFGTKVSIQVTHPPITSR